MSLLAPAANDQYRGARVSAWFLALAGLLTLVPGLIHAFGFTGAGFQIAPGVGEVLAELVRDGCTSTPIEAFSISRFSRPATSRPDQDRISHGSGAGQPPEPQNRGIHS